MVPERAAQGPGGAGVGVGGVLGTPPGAVKQQVGPVGSGACLLGVLCPLSAPPPPHLTPLGETKGELLVGLEKGYPLDFL